MSCVTLDAGAIDELGCSESQFCISIMMRRHLSVLVVEYPQGSTEHLHCGLYFGGL